MEVHGGDEEGASDANDDSEDWAAQYQAYLNESELENSNGGSDEENGKSGDDEELEVEEWAVQYAKHCEEKEKEFLASIEIKKC